MDVPILMLVFNRPELSSLVFDRIRRARPRQLYIAADGPRVSVPGEIERCEKTKKIVTDIDWDCVVKTLFRDQNLGCGVAVSGAIDWFFTHVKEGIILEDDCLPGETFFSFCEHLLNRYRDEKRVMHIGGSNYQNGVVRGDGSYYFSRYAHIWGWATWKDRWDSYDFTLNRFRGLSRKELRSGIRAMMELVLDGHLNTWDVQWFMSIWFQNGMSVTPNVSLVRNIGFGESATHTRRKPSWMKVVKYGEIQHVIDPTVMQTDDSADSFVYKKMFRQISIKRKILLVRNFLRSLL